MYSYYNYALWIALILFLLSFLISGREVRPKAIIAGLGWIAFSIHWFTQPAIYLQEIDPFNAFLTFVMAIFSLVVAFSFMTEHKDSLFLLTRVVAIACIFYFPFASITPLHNALISLNTHCITEGSRTVFGIKMVLDDPLIYLNNHRVRLILGCTAIESIALFIGVIFGVKASLDRKLAAFLVSVPVIFLLNVVRNIFVIVAYSNDWFDGWFGLGSFYVAHNVIAKIGSTIALIIIAYVVLTILPEVLDLIEDAWRDIRAIVIG